MGLQDGWAQQQWESHIPALTHRLQLKQGSLTGQQVDALWHLCQQEAGLWGITHKACSLFPPQACSLLRTPPLSAHCSLILAPPLVTACTTVTVTVCSHSMPNVNK